MAIFNRKKNNEEPSQIEPSLEEQLTKRQSAPQPTMADFVRQQGQQMMQGQGISDNGAVDGFKVIDRVIGREQIQQANITLQKYKEGKANLEKRIVENEQWYKIRHWATMRKKEPNMVEPASAWLFNSIANKHADAMDNFPSPNVLPREEGDKPEAEMLSSIIPVILEQNDYEQTYSDVWMYKLKSGTGVYGVFWNSQKNNIGDIDVRKIDLINLFWESGITDIQKSRNLFHVELFDNDVLLNMYPQLEGKLGKNTSNIAQYLYDDTVDTSDKTPVVDWYYKKSNSQGKQVLHYVKYCNDEVLFATENDSQFAERGFYDHAQYPFVFDPLFSTEGTPTGFGYIDVGKDAQEYIDRGNQAIMQNLLANTRPRHFVRNGAGVNESEYLDLTKDIVHVDGDPANAVLAIQGKALSDIYVSVINNKIDELKETTGNRDISTGGTTSGVTAASAIAAMQEAGSKLSRDNIKASYRAFRKVVVLVIELIRQFYDLPRCFRIMGQDGAERYIQYTNAGIQPQMQGDDFGVSAGYRIPLFDIEVTAQKQSPYSKMSQNELALQFYGQGFFNPQMADQALACLDMMDFDRKTFVMQKIAENGGMYQQMLAMQQQMMMLAQMVDQSRGSNIAEQLAAQFGGGQPVAPIDGKAPNVDNTEALGGDGNGESNTTKKARQRVADSTSPT